ncbi:ATP-binding protein, partial [Candidatus Babeliales bacterium]|nr:ATP-binding protein [Candidatus Babeliales bacterium]
MTNKIKILTPQESIKIAAGEVIERPAHILKELIENSLDARAKNIIINIQKAGKFLIKITDDGIGMSPDDAQLCFAHHATSKISSIDDLQTITTFGFRGEALSSIASVSHISLITKTENEKLATNVDLKFGTITAVTQTSFPTGTTITITQLFDNIPARKKFLKTDETERNCIINIFQAFALQRIDVTFKLFDQDVLLFNCTATSTLQLRCAQLWDNYLHQNLILLEPEHDLNFTITGAISTPAYQRFGR